MSDEKHKLTPEQKQTLSMEYQVCQSKAQSFESPIWQTNAVIGVGSVGALIAVLSNTPEFTVLVMIGFVVNGVAFIWFKMAQRWWSIQQIALRRAYELEGILDFCLEREIEQQDSRTVRGYARFGPRFWIQCFLAVSAIVWIGCVVWVGLRDIKLINMCWTQRILGSVYILAGLAAIVYYGCLMCEQWQNDRKRIAGRKEEKVKNTGNG